MSAGIPHRDRGAEVLDLDALVDRPAGSRAAPAWRRGRHHERGCRAPGPSSSSEGFSAAHRSAAALAVVDDSGRSRSFAIRAAPSSVVSRSKTSLGYSPVATRYSASSQAATSRRLTSPVVTSPARKPFCTSAGVVWKTAARWMPSTWTGSRRVGISAAPSGFHRLRMAASTVCPVRWACASDLPELVGEEERTALALVAARAG